MWPAGPRAPESLRKRSTRWSRKSLKIFVEIFKFLRILKNFIKIFKILRPRRVDHPWGPRTSRVTYDRLGSDPPLKRRSLSNFWSQNRTKIDHFWRTGPAPRRDLGYWGTHVWPTRPDRAGDLRRRKFSEKSENLRMKNFTNKFVKFFKKVLKTFKKVLKTFYQNVQPNCTFWSKFRGF